MLEGAARSFRRAGFRDIVLIGDHGGYQSDLAAVAATAEPRMGGDAGARPFHRRVLPGGDEPLRRAPCASAASREAQIGTHAGSADTSLMLAVDPRLVRADRAGAAARPRPTAPTATRGPSTAALGQAGVDLIVAASVNAIRRATVR